ncbi:F0F1 ATP synthase subunit gamma [Georgenia thermotolerans]|uniref:ATP synthase gamma chain n=1 Tax=Georgenia thermotolerans TaxID=527326 RepID=A0A7J5UL24_9MICO|nr:F0F1 ATP synthase subunit gamma [Georgenia thermotolerans]KAE8763088.1 F0F1 ATP synthase subunit gamma [Georgenia thermotolerans]
MAGSQRVYKQKIRATQTLKKVFRAMELIAASRIGKARDAAQGTDAYTRALIRAVGAVSAHANLNHPLIAGRTDTNRVAVFAVTSDRGMAGAYSATILRETERLIERLEDEGKEVALYVSGRRGESYFRFRGREIVRSWTEGSDNPQPERAREIADALLGAYLAPVAEGGVSELHVVYTRFETMVTQVPQVRRMLPIEVVEGEGSAEGEALPLYEFEPSADEVLDALLPMYVRRRIYGELLMAAASELASRQRAMHTATDNAENLIRDYTRLANTARQADITSEITEIVSGADALASSR